MLFENDITSEIYNTKNLKKSLKYANKINANYAIIIGAEEFANKQVSIKNLETGNQIKIKKDKISEYFKMINNFKKTR